MATKNKTTILTTILRVIIADFSREGSQFSHSNKIAFLSYPNVDPFLLLVLALNQDLSTNS